MAVNDNAISCGGGLTLIDLMAATLGKTAAGKIYVRRHDVTAVAGSKAFACGNPVSEQEVIDGIASAFTLDANGDIAIRMSLAT